MSVNLNVNVNDMMSRLGNYLGGSPSGYIILWRYGDSVQFNTWIGDTKLTIYSAFPDADHWAGVRIEANFLGIGLAAEQHNVGGSQRNNRVEASIVRNWGGMKIKVINNREVDQNGTHFPVAVKTE